MFQWSLANLLAWAVQVTAIVAAGGLLLVWLRVREPGARLIFLRTLLLVCVALPLLQPWAVAPAGSLASVDARPPAAASSPVDARAELPSVAISGYTAAGPAPSSSAPWRPIAIGVLAIGVVCRTGWLGLGLISLMRLRRSSKALEPQPAAVGVAESVVGATASFRVSPRVQRPVTFGLRQPVVLVPDGFLEYAPAEQSAIACHELLHVRRRDWLRALAEEFVCAVLWFHPAIWWLTDQIHLTAEQVIDREVVRLIGDRRSYLHALLRLAATGPAPMLQPAALFLKHGHLRQRVAMLIKETPMSRFRLAASFAVVLILLACGGWLIVQAFPLWADGAQPPVVGEVQAYSAPATTPAALKRPDAPSASATAKPQSKPTAGPNSQAPRPGMMTGPAGPAWPEITRLGTVIYPPDALEAGWSGTVTVAAGIDASGNVITAQATSFAIHANKIAFEAKSRADGMAARLFDPFRDAALEAVRQTKFKPLGRAFANFTIGCEFDSDRATARLVPGLPPSQQTGTMNEQHQWAEIPPNAVRVGGHIAPPKKLKDVKPVYPAVALNARVQGVVIVEAVIGEEGRVSTVRVLRSIPLLDQAALDAVRQWEFVPTLLNGAPIPVIATMTVNFTLSASGSGTGVGAGSGFGTGVGGGVGGGVPGGIAGGVTGGVPGGVTGGVVSGGTAYPPPPPLPPDTVRVGGGIRPPTKVVDVKAVYPAEAKDAGVQGVVILEVVIGKDGKVIDAKVLRSIPLLDQAALDAVRQWEFTPTQVNDVPLNVVMTVTVNFTLM
ncbi:MAG: M56 family metallopeptidase [Acidobacteria bacterium]|nr:M56 family metallopeptidase [Acidobacteriota bacterium]